MLRRLGVNVIVVKRLHTKLYINERECIVSSMNLSETSDNHSKEMGLYFSEGEDYNRIYDYFMTHIKSESEVKHVSSDYKSRLNTLHTYLETLLSDKRF